VPLKPHDAEEEDEEPEEPDPPAPGTGAGVGVGSGTTVTVLFSQTPELEDDDADTDAEADAEAEAPEPLAPLLAELVELGLKGLQVPIETSFVCESILSLCPISLETAFAERRVDRMRVEERSDFIGLVLLYDFAV
jgi:hypothetical protein